MFTYFTTHQGGELWPCPGGRAPKVALGCECARWARVRVNKTQKALLALRGGGKALTYQRVLPKDSWGDRGGYVPKIFGTVRLVSGRGPEN